MLLIEAVVRLLAAPQVWLSVTLGSRMAVVPTSAANSDTVQRCL